MRTSEIADRWKNYFARNDHEVLPSVPLVSPDPSILFTIAGMVPFIPYIIGAEQAPWPRVASVQKCLRTNDIDNVGRTTRHGTFFQMNGNFSFGDYFKEGAIKFAWELLTSSQADGGYGLDGDRMWVTIWEEDKEAEDALIRGIGLDPRHVVKLKREENFWDTGQPGPAGPCAEWHYDRGPAYGPEAEGGNVDPGGDRYLELWNLVFDQYLRGEGAGKDYPLLGELEKKAIDTGAGLERLAFVLQNQPNMYEIDEVRPVITATEALSERRYLGGDPEDDVRMRIVADHVRSAMMLICDGVVPGNDGRGYVLRRLLRRAIRSMRLLGVDTHTLPTLMPVSRDAMKASYPQLETDWQRISDVAYAEEESFLRTLSAGTTILDTAVKRAQAAGQSRLSGDDAFALHDTYGFPIDLTLEMAKEHGVGVDEVRFRELMQEQKLRARQDALAKKAGHVDARVYHEILNHLGGQPQFVGYTDSTVTTSVAGIVAEGKPTAVVSAPADVEVVLATTPFYAEMGGQLADHGTIRTAGGAVVDVIDVQAPIKGMPVHRGRLVEGTLTVDDSCVAQIDTQRRLDIARAHTATHMVHKGLHEFLGEGATQAGSENSPSRMRFDFRHSSAVPADVMAQLDERVNQRVADDLSVTDTITDLETAKSMGAMALFGEKYGDQVRVVNIGDGWSLELCAGTHVPSTGHIGRIAVLGESSIGSGVRRIDALVGDGAYGFQAKEHALVSQLTSLMGGKPEELPGRIDALLHRLKEAEKQLAQLASAQLMTQAEPLAGAAVKVGSALVVLKEIGAVSSSDALRDLATAVRDRLADDSPVVVMLIGRNDGRAAIVVATNEAGRQLGLQAGPLVKEAASVLGGGGGGRPDIAQGAGTKLDRISAAIDAIKKRIEQV